MKGQYSHSQLTHEVRVFSSCKSALVSIRVCMTTLVGIRVWPVIIVWDGALQMLGSQPWFFTLSIALISYGNAVISAC